MSKVITFSRYFPKGHPREGEPTLFVEKIWRSLYNMDTPISKFVEQAGLEKEKDNFCSPLKIDSKHHTIRAGRRWKVGDTFSPRVWSGKPYSSKQIQFAYDIVIKKVWDFKIEVDNDYICVLIDNWPFYEENATMVTQHEAMATLAANDGLTLDEMKDWLKWGKPFDGQIICWNENINY